MIHKYLKIISHVQEQRENVHLYLPKLSNYVINSCLTSDSGLNGLRAVIHT